MTKMIFISIFQNEFQNVLQNRSVAIKYGVVNEWIGRVEATIDGKPLKYIVRKGTPEHDTLTKTGLANLTEEMMKELTERYLLPKIQ